MTDAGFRNPWFRLIAAQGWQWVGRVRNRDYVRKNNIDDWLPAKQLYGQAHRGGGLTVDRRDHHIMQGAPARGVHQWQTALHDLRYDGLCVHGSLIR